MSLSPAPVRWPQRRGHRTGFPTGRTNRDGSIEVADDRGNVRSIPAERLEMLLPGPRGGKPRWVPYTQPQQLAMENCNT